mgnify:CR=1 FL=1
MNTHKDMLGERFDEIEERVKRAASYSDLLPEREQEFLQDLAVKLASYGRRALVSVNQLNWLTRIEAKIERAG